jgi:alpha-glucosidase
LYRDGLRIRRAERWSDALSWVEADADVLAFRRGPRFLCVVNLSDAPAALPTHEDVILASGPLAGQLPPDTAAWLRTADQEGPHA